MPGITFGTVTDPSNNITPDNGSGNFNMGHANEMFVAELYGKNYQHTYRGNIFIGSTTTAGVVIPIATTKTPLFTIWNPQGSGKLLVPIVTLLGYNATTGVLGALVWMATTNAGSTTGATNPIVSFTSPATPVSANLNANAGISGKQSVIKVGNDTTTISITAAATVYRGLGITVTAHTAAGDQALSVAREEWDGMGIIPPNNAIHLMGSTAVAATLFVSLVWAELPL